jgi:dihydrofolate reductase
MIMYGTLDGIAEFPTYEEDATPVEEDDVMWSPRMGSIDTILLGGRAYAKWAEFWPPRKDAPDATKWEKSFSRFADKAEKVVFSRTLPEANWENSRIVRDDFHVEVARLKKLEGKEMALGGGPRLAQSFLDADLVDEILMEIFPSIVGKGKPLFRVAPDPDNLEDMIPTGAPGRHDFKLLEAKGLRDGTVFLHYQRPGE